MYTIFPATYVFTDKKKWADYSAHPDNYLYMYYGYTIR